VIGTPPPNLIFQRLLFLGHSAAFPALFFPACFFLWRLPDTKPTHYFRCLTTIFFANENSVPPPNFTLSQRAGPLLEEVSFILQPPLAQKPVVKFLESPAEPGLLLPAPLCNFALFVVVFVCFFFFLVVPPDSSEDERMWRGKSFNSYLFLPFLLCLFFLRLLIKIFCRSLNFFRALLLISPQVPFTPAQNPKTLSFSSPGFFGLPPRSPPLSFTYALVTLECVEFSLNPDRFRSRVLCNNYVLPLPLENPSISPPWPPFGTPAPPQPLMLGRTVANPLSPHPSILFSPLGVDCPFFPPPQGTCQSRGSRCFE